MSSIESFSDSEPEEITMEIDTDSAVPINWNDTYFKDNYMKIYRVKERVNLSHSILCAKAFLNFYVFARKPEKLDDILLGVLSGVTINNAKDHLITDYMFDQESTVTLRHPGSVEKVTEGEWSTTGEGEGDFTHIHVKYWYNELWKNLELTEESAGSDLCHATVNYLGFIIVQMIRLVRNPTEVVAEIRQHTNNNFYRIWSRDFEIEYTLPPSDQARRIFSKIIKIYNPAFTRILTWFVSSYAFNASSKAQSIFVTGGLIRLHEGQESFRWQHEASKATGKNVIDMFTIPEAIFLFIKNIMYNPNVKTWRWARLFTNKVFEEITAERNMLYVATLMALTFANTPENDVEDVLEFQDFIRELNVEHRNIHMIKAILRGKKINVRIAEHVLPVKLISD